jgi:hypothetical protein
LPRARLARRLRGVMPPRGAAASGSGRPAPPGASGHGRQAVASRPAAHPVGLCHEPLRVGPGRPAGLRGLPGLGPVHKSSEVQNRITLVLLISFFFIRFYSPEIIRCYFAKLNANRLALDSGSQGLAVTVL